MSRSRGRKSRSGELDQILQVRMTSAAKGMLEERAKRHAIPVGAYLRQIVYRDLGLITDAQEKS